MAVNLRMLHAKCVVHQRKAKATQACQCVLLLSLPISCQGGGTSVTRLPSLRPDCQPLRYDTAAGFRNHLPDPSSLVVISSRCIGQNVRLSSVDFSNGCERRAERKILESKCVCKKGKRWGRIRRSERLEKFDLLNGYD